MLLTIGIGLVLIWLMGAVIFHVVAGLMYAALVLGLILIAWHWVSRAMHHPKPTSKS
ncbi:MAG: hypothetical protein M0Z54_11810 [Thermaerobacter sp.]|nr:hypothetical protein [Thermaerobacter sp.]